MTERDFATEVVQRLQQAGYSALFAGGCVRDELLGLHPADYDIATSAVPDQVRGLFRRCHFFGASFGVVEVLGPRDAAGQWIKVQVATFRSDGTYTDGRRPDSVTFSSPEEDAARRDFTINGMFFDPVANGIIDYVGGEADLKARILRAIGDPILRFREDKLRILRAVRMATRFELRIDPATQSAAQAMASEISAVSQERIAEELRKLLAHRHRARGVELIQEFGLFPHILPEIPTSPQRVGMVAALPEHASFELALAALGHDLTKAQMTNLGKRLKLSNQELERIAWLVEHGTRLRTAPSLPKSQLYPILAHRGVRELLDLHRAEAMASGGELRPVEFCEELLHRVPKPYFDPPPLLTGDDLMQMGLKPGPAFKTLLDQLRQRQLDAELTSPQEARDWVQKQTWRS